MTTDLGSPIALANTLVLQPDGKLVVLGTAAVGVSPTTSANLALVRYNADGGLDTAFGDGGRKIIEFGETRVYGIGLVLRPDGKLVALADFPNEDADELVRFNANGSLDATFGPGGRVAVGSLTSKLALQPDGKYVAAGYESRYPDYPTIFTLARYNADGSPDTAFGGGAKVSTVVGSDGNSPVTGLALETDGKIVIAGHNDFSNPILVRYTSDGLLDATFGTAGKVMSNTGPNYANPILALQPDGKLAATFSGDYASGFLLARYLP